VIDSSGWEFSFAFDLYPSERSLDDVKDPAIINTLVSDVSSKNNEVRF